MLNALNMESIMLTTFELSHRGNVHGRNKKNDEDRERERDRKTPIETGKNENLTTTSVPHGTTKDHKIMEIFLFAKQKHIKWKTIW